MAPKTSLFCLFLCLCLNLAYAQDTAAAHPKLSPSVAIEPGILHSLVKHEVAPEYPAAALQNHTEGLALVKFFVDGNGTVQKALADDCEKCSPMFREAAVKAVEQWQYQPIRLDGKPVTVRSFVVFRFRLENGPSVEVVTKPEDSSLPAAPPYLGASILLAPWALHAKLTHGAAPEYPAAALEERTEGAVSVEVSVDGSGKVEKVLETDCPSCSAILQKAAVQAVEQWQYQPTLLNGKPVTVSSRVMFRFRLQGRSVEIATKDEPKFESVTPGNMAVGAIIVSEIVPSYVAERNLVSKVEPQYPKIAKVAHIQGDVIINCTINREGEVAEAKALSGHPLLVQPALDAVKQWKYKPFLWNGKPIAVESTITVHFRM